MTRTDIPLHNFTTGNKYPGIMEQWKHLRVVNEQIPPLLIKSTFGKHGYSIKLTDLSRIWVETLSRDEIITRARKRNCSIDPGEDGSQHRIFLDKLQSALNQDGKTNLAFSATNHGKLKLHLEAPLPSPLPTFEWEVDLKRSNDSELGAELVSPLLRRAHILNRRMELLIAELHAKDKIISKITDRLETSGHDLTAVFPGLSNVKLTRSTSQQEQLARHIRGLGKFDEATWKAHLSTATDTAVLPESSEDDIFASLPQASVISDDADKAANWWQQIPVGRHIDLEEEVLEDAPGGAGRVPDQQRSLLRQETSDVDQYDGFQRQATPPRLRNHSPPTAIQEDVEMSGTGGPALSDEDSTEDEDDLDRPSQKPSTSRIRTTHETIAAQASSEPTSPTPPQSSNSAAQPATTSGPFTHEEDTEEDDDDDLDGPSQPSQKSTSTSQLASRQKSQTPQPTASTITSKSPPRKTLGKLGGHLSTKPANKSPSPPSEEEPPKPTPTTNPPLRDPQPKPKSKLGKIGGIKAKPQPQTEPPPPVPPAATASTTRSAAATAGKSTATPEPQPRPTSSRQQAELQCADNSVEPKTVEQTEAERADAKREALKRELEAKAKAPVKKKRKF
jgi:hypothetical protein